MAHKNATFALLILLSNCSAPSRHPTAASPNRVVLSGRDANSLLNQCSRTVPKSGQSTWQPSEKDLDAFEAALPSALSKSSERETNFGDVLSRWRRQYIGLVRGGRRYIYGNYFPVSMSEEFPKWRTEPAMVCDGGPAFFGAEFDVQAGRFTQLDFNGVA